MFKKYNCNYKDVEILVKGFSTIKQGGFINNLLTIIC